MKRSLPNVGGGWKATLANPPPDRRDVPKGSLKPLPNVLGSDSPATADFPMNAILEFRSGDRPRRLNNALDYLDGAKLIQPAKPLDSRSGSWSFCG
jgi:hypothetical protein